MGKVAPGDVTRTGAAPQAESVGHGGQETGAERDAREDRQGAANRRRAAGHRTLGPYQPAPTAAGVMAITRTGLPEPCSIFRDVAI